MIGHQVELWQYEYVRRAYADQLGVEHDANVVRRKVVVTIVATKPIVGEWSGKTYDDGLWFAKDAAGVEYQQRLDEISMSGRWVWSDSLGHPWYTAERHGFLVPYMNPDGTKAVPQVLNARTN